MVGEDGVLPGDIIRSTSADELISRTARACGCTAPWGVIVLRGRTVVFH